MGCHWRCHEGAVCAQLTAGAGLARHTCHEALPLCGRLADAWPSLMSMSFIGYLLKVPDQ